MSMSRIHCFHFSRCRRCIQSRRLQVKADELIGAVAELQKLLNEENAKVIFFPQKTQTFFSSSSSFCPVFLGLCLESRMNS